MQINLCSVDFEMVFPTSWTGANISECFVTSAYCVWRIRCKNFWRTYVHCRFAWLKNASCVTYALFLESTLRKRNSLQLVGLRIAVIFILTSIWFFNYEVIKTESSYWWLNFTRPLGLPLFAIWCSVAYLLQHKYSFMTHDKNNEARCKKSFLG